MFWRSDKDANLNYLSDDMRSQEIARCQEGLAKDQAAEADAKEAPDQNIEILPLAL